MRKTILFAFVFVLLLACAACAETTEYTLSSSSRPSDHFLKYGNINFEEFFEYRFDSYMFDSGLASLVNKYEEEDKPEEKYSVELKYTFKNSYEIEDMMALSAHLLKRGSNFGCDYFPSRYKINPQDVVFIRLAFIKRFTKKAMPIIVDDYFKLYEILDKEEWFSGESKSQIDYQDFIAPSKVDYDMESLIDNGDFEAPKEHVVKLSFGDFFSCSKSNKPGE